MENAVSKVGLPVSCAYGDCEVTGRVKPHDHNGWYKSKLLRKRWRKRWFCPEHYESGREIDNRFYQNYLTPDPYSKEEAQLKLSSEEELYKLLDD